MALQIPDHAHCYTCGRAVAVGDKTCSKECDRKYGERQRRSKRLITMMYVGMAIALAVFALSYVRPGLF
jgi:predicted nucleic acid-binding Zn ribbon protein